MAKLAEINRVDQKRYFDVKADVLPGCPRWSTSGPDGDQTLVTLQATPDGAITGPNGATYALFGTVAGPDAASVQSALDNGARIIRSMPTNGLRN